MTNDFYTITTTSGESVEVYLTDAGFQSLDGTGRVFYVEDTLYISKFDEEGSLIVYSINSEDYDLEALVCEASYDGL